MLFTAIRFYRSIACQTPRLAAAPKKPYFGQLVWSFKAQYIILRCFTGLHQNLSAIAHNNLQQMNIMSSWILFECYQCEVLDCEKFPALHVVLLKITAPIEATAITNGGSATTWSSSLSHLQSPRLN